MVSGCILVKNEEKTLRDCLMSIAELCDEIIVIDNQSDDRTKQIAETFGCRVYESASESLDEIRNRFTEYARFPWILSIDADERLSHGSAERIRSILRETGEDIWGYTVPIITYCGSGQWTEGNFLRLYRNRKEIHYSDSPIHASLSPSIQEAGKRIERLDMPFHHMDLFVRDTRPKREKYKQLILEQLKRQELEGETRYYLQCFLGGEYIYEEMWDKAEKCYMDALRISPEKSTMAHAGLSQLYYDTNRTDQSLEISTYVLEHVNKRNKYALFNKARIHCGSGNYGEAVREMQEFIRLYPNSATGYFNLACLYFFQGEAFEDLLTRAAEIDPMICNPMIYEEKPRSIYTKERIVFELPQEYVRAIGEILMVTGEKQ